MGQQADAVAVRSRLTSLRKRRASLAEGSRTDFGAAHPSRRKPTKTAGPSRTQSVTAFPSIRPPDGHRRGEVRLERRGPGTSSRSGSPKVRRFTRSGGDKPAVEHRLLLLVIGLRDARTRRWPARKIVRPGSALGMASPWRLRLNLCRVCLRGGERTRGATRPYGWDWRDAITWRANQCS